MKKKQEIILLGTMKSRIVGVQYYKQRYKVEASLYFDRNPYNEYDENAIEISNSNGILGHLNRKEASWVAPMIDRGEVFLKGKVKDEGDNWRIPIEIEIYQTKNGKGILKKREQDSPENVIHNILLDIFTNSDSYSGETISGLRRYFLDIIRSRKIMPETRLIFKLLKNKINRSRKKDFRVTIDTIKDYCDILKYGTPIKHGGITIVPLINDVPDTSLYNSSKKALKDKSLIIEEIGDSGQVSRVRATNRGSKPVMLISGEGLTGAKQDRIINVTVIIGVNDSVDVPVSCVERGRWEYSKESTFNSANFATHEIRSSIREDINSNIISGVKSFDSDQDMVWHGVAETVADYNLHTQTENLNEVYKAKRADIEKAIKHFKYVKGSVGVAIFANGKEISIDLFCNKSLMKENWKDIISSVVLERGRGGSDLSESLTKPAISKNIKNFFTNVCTNALETEASSGKGSYIVSKDDEFNVGTLVANGRVAHLSGLGLTHK